jgi:5-methylthioadenosine/S-adenosylhomocysteine deaminase
MEQADIILTGGTVVTMNERFDLFEGGAVAIRAEKIVAVGPADAILAAWEADTVLDCSGKYVLPGLVNAHTHAPMTLLRGLADDLRLDVWLMGYCMPTEREFVNPEFCRLGTSLACAEMIRSGITAFADMYYFESDVAAATAAAGMRGVLGQTVLKFPAPDAETYDDSLRYAREFIETWKGHPLVTPAVAPHAPYSNTAETLRLCAELAVEYDVPLLTHIAETKLEVEDMLAQEEMRVVPWVDSVGLFQAKVLCAHCVHIDTSEMPVLREAGATVAHCPQSNLKLASGIAPITEMLAADLTVGIGTDGPASNNDLDMFEEMRLAAILAKTEANDPTTVPARQALLMATRQGAEALFMGDKTGSLEVGKLADLIVMDARPVHNMPAFRRDMDAVYSRIVYAGKSTDVTDVMCHGKWLMRERALLTLDEESLIREAEAYAERVDAFLLAREENVLSKLLAIGGLRQSESFEVQLKARLRDESVLDHLLKHPDVQILKHVHYRQYDTYFLFDDAEQSRIRYREDDMLDSDGDVVSVRSRLTFTAPTKRQHLESAAVLSKSRFIADADRPLRFYREYFRPSSERELHKERRRWHILYQGVLFYVNLDTVHQPALEGSFVEIKARTWSATDATEKVHRIQAMMEIIGVSGDDVLVADYLALERA